MNFSRVERESWKFFQKWSKRSTRSLFASLSSSARITNLFKASKESYSINSNTYACLSLDNSKKFEGRLPISKKEKARGVEEGVEEEVEEGVEEGVEEMKEERWKREMWRRREKKEREGRERRWKMVERAAQFPNCRDN